MRLAVNLGSSAGNDASWLDLAVAAEHLGYDCVWAAEAYASDAVSVLAWVGARTQRIGLGSAVLQIPGRTPAMTAMTAASLDTLSDGRFRLGLGVSGPQVSEGWHGVRFEHPLERTREYVDVVRLALARTDVAYQGAHWHLPLPDGEGRPLRLGVRRVRERIPLYLAATGPRNCRLAGEIADGVLGVFFAPEHAQPTLAAIREGRRIAGHDTEPGTDPLDRFEIVPTVPVSVGPDVEAAAEPIRRYAALYLGGMGSRRHNFYNDLARRMGFEQAAAQVQDLFLAGNPRDAARAVPAEFIDATSLVGPVERIADRLHAYADIGVTTLAVTPFAQNPTARVETLRAAVTAIERAGLV
ncbi:MAG TPA: LLM class F420-dependent oxidoreductase [Kineosporiaceae bacterium]